MLNGCELFLLFFGFGFIYPLIKWLFPPQLRACDFVVFEFSNICDKSVDFDW